MDLAFLTPRADHHPSPHATRMVIGQQTASRRTFIIRVWAQHEQRYTRLTTAIRAARDLHIPSSLRVPAATGHPSTAVGVSQVPSPCWIGSPRDRPTVSPSCCLHPSKWIVAVTRGTWPTTRVVCPCPVRS